MESLQIDILNPKAKKLLKELADLKLIKINKQPKTPDFTSLLKKFRTSLTDELTFDEITKEVELVRKNDMIKKKIILDTKTNNEILMLTDQQKEDIMASKKEVESGLIFSEKQLDKEIQEWLSVK